MPLVIITVLFGLSLLAAWVLFKVLQSTATVSKPEYQLGGAAAGFVVILTLLSVTYMQVDDKKKQQTISDLQDQLKHANALATKGKECLTEQSAAEVIYSGTVTPPVQNANVVLGVSAVQLQQSGKFAIKVHNVKPSDLPYIYVIGADSHAPYLQVFAKDDPGNLMIPH
jgi:hypothetical protein